MDYCVCAGQRNRMNECSQKNKSKSILLDYSVGACGSFPLYFLFPSECAGAEAPF
jgi:hypothetical protein